MRSNTVILILGSNLGHKSNNLDNAISFIRKYLGIIVKISKVLETEPVGFNCESMFLNQALEIETLMSPLDLLQEIKIIEEKMGRDFSVPTDGQLYASRIIDIDIVTYGNLVFESKALTLPHPQLFQRAYVKACINLLETV